MILYKSVTFCKVYLHLNQCCLCIVRELCECSLDCRSRGELCRTQKPPNFKISIISWPEESDRSQHYRFIYEETLYSLFHCLWKLLLLLMWRDLWKSLMWTQNLFSHLFLTRRRRRNDREPANITWHHSRLRSDRNTRDAQRQLTRRHRSDSQCLIMSLFISRT